MSNKLQARYNPERYPFLHEWWSNIPDGKRSQYLCEFLEYALPRIYDEVPESREAERLPTLDETHMIVKQVVQEAVLELMDELGRWRELDRYTIAPAPSEPYEQSASAASLRGLLGAHDGW